MLIPANETRQLWCEINTTGLPRGRYVERLSLSPLNAPGRCTRKVVTLIIDVTDLRLPREHPLQVFVFDYDSRHSDGGRDLSSHYVNCFHNCLSPHPAGGKPDFRAHDRAIRREMSYAGARSVYFEHWHFRQSDAWTDAEKRATWVAGTRKWARHVHEDLGLGFDRFTLHIFDECL